MEEMELDIPALFGKNVQKYRKQNGLTQAELSKQLDISQKHLSIIETGTQFASASLIARISKVLHVSPAALFGEDINQEYMDNLYDRLAEHINKRSLFIINNLSHKR